MADRRRRVVSSFAYQSETDTRVKVEANPPPLLLKPNTRIRERFRGGGSRPRAGDNCRLTEQDEHERERDYTSL
jgi:hypothetical protein